MNKNNPRLNNKRTYYVLKFEDQSYGVWWESKISKMLSNNKALVEQGGYSYQGTILSQGSKKNAKSLFITKEKPKFSIIRPKTKLQLVKKKVFKIT
jgi:hypothetical protein